MRLLTYQIENKMKDLLGILDEDGMRIYPLEQFGMQYLDMNDLITKVRSEKLEEIRARLAAGAAFSVAVEKTRKRPPIPFPRQDIICLGINYLAHAEEAARYKAEAFGGERSYAIYFSKRVDEAVADGDLVPAYAGLVDSLDYEVELAVIIGRAAKAVTREQAFEHVFGYTILNDISARNLQTRHQQWYFGKSLDGFTPMGPYIVTADAVQEPPVLSVCSRVNGEIRQNSSTDLLIFDIPHVISELSRGMTLKPGTIISMGTPAGVGMGFDPPCFLKQGDMVECEIEGIGVLTNRIGE